MYLPDEHYFTFSAGLGLGTNNYAELLALKLLITLALKNGVHTLQIFGDSQLVINWVSGKFRINNILLTQVLQEVIRISDFLVKVDYKHIYRERNSKANALANAKGIGLSRRLEHLKLMRHFIFFSLNFSFKVGGGTCDSGGI